jgi:hypothetical protein
MTVNQEEHLSHMKQGKSPIHDHPGHDDAMHIEQQANVIEVPLHRGRDAMNNDQKDRT